MGLRASLRLRPAFAALLLCGFKAQLACGTWGGEKFLGGGESRKEDDLVDSLVAAKSAEGAGIEGAMGRGREAVETHLMELSGQLQPIFNTLPRNAHGRLESAGLRYLLHRHFSQHQGWLMRGLAPDGGAWDAPFPLQILKAAPPDVRRTLASRLASQGLSLKDVAAVAAVLEDLVEKDASARLWEAWRLHRLKSQSDATMEELEGVVDTYTLTYLLDDFWPDIEHGRVHANNLAEKQATMAELYPGGWEKTKLYLRSMVTKALEKKLTPDFRPKYQDAELATSEVLEHFGVWQDRECEGLKQKLVGMESSSGRVGLDAFYREGMKNGTGWMFSESIPYMRELGVLDETDPDHPAVLIPNYITSAANHIGTSHYFEVACIDACDLGSIERLVGRPAARPERIVEVVQSLSSLGHPGEVSDALLKELREVASANGGEVPLHSRAFATWLHHLQPQDCPRPPAEGTTRQWQPLDYEANTGEAYIESYDGMLRVVQRLQQAVLHTLRSTPAPSSPLPAQAARQDNYRDQPTARPSERPIPAMVRPPSPRCFVAGVSVTMLGLALALGIRKFGRRHENTREPALLAA